VRNSEPYVHYVGRYSWGNYFFVPRMIHAKDLVDAVTVPSLRGFRREFQGNDGQWVFLTADW